MHRVGHSTYIYTVYDPRHISPFTLLTLSCSCKTLTSVSCVTAMIWYQCIERWSWPRACFCSSYNNNILQLPPGLMSKGLCSIIGGLGIRGKKRVILNVFNAYNTLNSLPACYDDILWWYVMKIYAFTYHASQPITSIEQPVLYPSRALGLPLLFFIFVCRTCPALSSSSKSWTLSSWVKKLLLLKLLQIGHRSSLPCTQAHARLKSEGWAHQFHCLVCTPELLKPLKGFTSADTHGLP